MTGDILYYETHSTSVPLCITANKEEKTETIRTKLVENKSNSKDFWKQIVKIDPVSRSFCNTIDQAVGSEQVSEIFLTKYNPI